jgi:hypothetical protein
MLPNAPLHSAPLTSVLPHRSADVEDLLKVLDGIAILPLQAG